jgi:Ras GTPase-activating-like protein IQGAP2/3
VESHLEETEPQDGIFPDDRKLQLYGNLFFLLQTEPGHIANLSRLVALSEIDTLLQTVMFTLYGNQYESREEHLLLTMFQVIKIFFLKKKFKHFFNIIINFFFIVSTFCAI